MLRVLAFRMQTAEFGDLDRATLRLLRAAKDEGMHFLRESAIDRVKRGLTTLKEINKVTFIETAR